MTRFLIYTIGLALLFACCDKKEKKYNAEPYDEKEAKYRKVPLPFLLKRMIIDQDWQKRDSLTYLRFTGLEEIYFQSTDSVPAWITRFQHLKILGCLSVYEGEGVNSIPEDIGKLTKLEQLDLKHGKIEKIPPSIKELKNLIVLSLDDNNISSIPEEVMSLENLLQLSVGENNISEIPQDICRLKKLEDLNVGGNNISSLPDCLKELSELESLIIRNNPIKDFPGWIFNQPTKLTFIWMEGLPLDNFEEVQQQVDKIERENKRKKWELEKRQREEERKKGSH